MNRRPPPKRQVTFLLPNHSSPDDDDLQSNTIPPKSSKRTAESSALTKGNVSKKAKKKKKHVQEHESADENVDHAAILEEKGAKKQLFQRIWNEDDEVFILKGMIEHGENEGIDPALLDMFSFYDSIRDSIQLEASRSQLTYKVKKLKKKFLKNLEKSYDGINRTFANDHDQKCYDLSKRIWGTTACKGSLIAKVSRNRKENNVVEVKAKKSNLGSFNSEKKNVSTDTEVDRAVADPSSVVSFCMDLSLEKKIEEYASQLITGDRGLLSSSCPLA
ncbi:probable transcription factor At1g11510 [Impatiens glandulifera]|uniref:probable transcription factor At1g11510 n=1 Tax=Impatiens glandulifera TaxID=253017 RepID=UPI001FB0AEF7|nr:probable transcription factor At1g11510 [Impatiens glandulifera]